MRRGFFCAHTFYIILKKVPIAEHLFHCLFYYKLIILLFQYDRFVFRYQSLHYNPTDQVSHRTYTENNAVSCRFPGEAHKPSTRISENSDQVVHKAVFKIRMAPEEK